MKVRVLGVSHGEFQDKETGRTVPWRRAECAAEFDGQVRVFAVRLRATQDCRPGEYQVVPRFFIRDGKLEVGVGDLQATVQAAKAA